MVVAVIQSSSSLWEFCKKLSPVVFAKKRTEVTENAKYFSRKLILYNLGGSITAVYMH
jgi:hypothetical protein